MSKNVVNLLLYICAAFCVVLVITVPIIVGSNPSAENGSLIPWNTGNNNQGTGEHDNEESNKDTDSEEPDGKESENAEQDTFTFLPQDNFSSPDAYAINIYETFTLMDFIETNNPKNIISVYTFSDKIEVSDTAPFIIVGLLGGEAEIIIDVFLNGVSEQYKFYVTIIDDQPEPKDVYELVALKLADGIWQILLFKNSIQTDYDPDYLEYDTSRAIPDLGNIFIILGTDNITFRLLNFEISCILEL